MRVLLIILALSLAGCGVNRVLVKEPTCQKAGPGLLNCEKVMDL